MLPRQGKLGENTPFTRNVGKGVLTSFELSETLERVTTSILWQVTRQMLVYLRTLTFHRTSDKNILLLIFCKCIPQRAGIGH